MRLKITDKKAFEVNVFGADDFIKGFPELFTVGVPVVAKGVRYYITDGRGDVVSDSHFFTPEEITCSMRLIEEKKKNE